MAIADFGLEDKVAIVTGGSRGIGRSIALGLAEHGAHIALAARKPEALEETSAAVRATGRRAIGVSTNVRRTDELRRLVDETVREFGRVDILVNNAGTTPVFGPVEEIDERAWDVIMNTNVKAPHLLGNFAREAMLEHGVSRLVFSSSCTVYGEPTVVPVRSADTPRTSVPVRRSRRARRCRVRWATNGSPFAAST